MPDRIVGDPQGSGMGGCVCSSPSPGGVLWSLPTYHVFKTCCECDRWQRPRRTDACSRAVVLALALGLEQVVEFQGRRPRGGRLLDVRVEVVVAREGRGVRAGAHGEDDPRREVLDLEQEEDDEGVERDAENVHHGAAEEVVEEEKGTSGC